MCICLQCPEFKTSFPKSALRILDRSALTHSRSGVYVYLCPGIEKTRSKMQERLKTSLSGQYLKHSFSGLCLKLHACLVSFSSLSSFLVSPRSTTLITYRGIITFRIRFWRIMWMTWPSDNGGLIFSCRTFVSRVGIQFKPKWCTKISLVTALERTLSLTRRTEVERI